MDDRVAGTDVSPLNISAGLMGSWESHMGRGVRCRAWLRKEHLRLLFKSRDEVLLIRYDTQDRGQRCQHRDVQGFA